MMGGPGHIRQPAQVGDWGHSGLNFWDNDYDALKQIVRSMKPGEVEEAATAYSEMSTRMKTSYDILRRQAGALAEAWGGEPADRALAKMRKLHDAAHEIRSKSAETGAAFHGHAATQRKWQSTIKDEHWYGVEIGSGDTGVGDWLRGESHMGRELMQQMQQDTVKSNEKFPASLRTAVVTTEVDAFDPVDDGEGGGAAAGVDAGRPVSPTPGLGGSGYDASGASEHLIGGSGQGGDAWSGANDGGPVEQTLPGSVVGGDTSLAGMRPGPGGFGSTEMGSVEPGGGLGAAGARSGAGGAAFGGLGGGLGGAGAASGHVGRTALAGPGGHAPGRGGLMPMAPQSGQSDEKERERSSCLTEDEDVWDPGDDTTPPVIG